MVKQTVRLISLTKPVDPNHNAESLMAYCARVSSPNQDSGDYSKLLSYCANNGHWSVFEMADLCVEIVTTRAIAQQLLRHRSFSFQEFSQRYSESKFGYIPSEARRQDKKNRQNSIDDLPRETIAWFSQSQKHLFAKAYALYKEALDMGIAKECARMLLPLNTGSKLYMKGSIRSWLHYLQVRLDPATQLEHRLIAEQIKDILLTEFPFCSTVLSDRELAVEVKDQ